MSLAAACAWSLARSLLAALVAAPVCVWLYRQLRRLPQGARPAAWVLLAAPLVFPPLLSGYALSSAGLQLAGFTAALGRNWGPARGLAQWLADNFETVDESLLFVLLVIRSVPVGTLLLTCAPPPAMSAAALYCRRLALPANQGLLRRMLRLWPFQWYAGAREVVAAAAVMFLLGFQDFELASLLGRPAWTVWMFDAQAGKLTFQESAQAAWLPVVCQLAVFVPLGLALSRRVGARPVAESTIGAKPSVSWAQACYLLAAVGLACGLPLALIGGDLPGGVQALVADRAKSAWFARETLVGISWALVAAGAAAAVAARYLQNRIAAVAVLSLCLPGLFGSLLLGLGLLRVFQWPVLNAGYRTPISFLAGQFLFLLPRALLLQLIWQAMRRRSPRHLANLLIESPVARQRDGGRELAWRLDGVAQFWSVGLLTYWGYLELTLASLLGPATIVSIPVLLYNQMHFGKYAAVSALACLTVVAPAVVFVLAAAGRRFWSPWLWR
ncbi:MAG: hypothetical protein ACT4QC_19285 [Planctomycetaceae bacterium]